MTSVVPFDTLALASALRDEVGFEQQQAEGFARILSRALVGDRTAKADLRETELRLEAKIEAVKADLLKSILAIVVTAATLNVALVLGAMFGLAKLLGH